MKKLILHADDFGLSASVNDAIVDLGKKKRLSGAGVMTIFPESQYKANDLLTLEGFSIGLHITLTDQALCCYNSSLVDAAGKAYGIKEMIKKSATNQLDHQDLEKEIQLQIERFYDIFSRWPDYFDGHHHVQLLKPVRKALYNVTAALHIPVYIRSSYMPLSFGISAKEMVLRGLNKNMKKDVANFNWHTNSYFAGAYGKEGLEKHLDHILSKQKDDLLMMVHPGYMDDILKSRDHFQEERVIEHRYLSSDNFGQCLLKYGYYVG